MRVMCPYCWDTVIPTNNSCPICDYTFSVDLEEKVGRRYSSNVREIPKSLKPATVRDLDEVLVKCLRTAIQHTDEVIARYNFLYAGRVEKENKITPTWRVGEMCTSLRRELSPVILEMRGRSNDVYWIGLCNFLKMFYDNSMWHDYILPASSRSHYWNHKYTNNGESWEMSAARIQALVQEAKSNVSPKISSATSDLAEAEKELYHLMKAVEVSVGINKEADQVVSGLCKLAETLDPLE